MRGVALVSGCENLNGYIHLNCLLGTHIHTHTHTLSLSLSFSLRSCRSSDWVAVRARALRRRRLRCSQFCEISGPPLGAGGASDFLRASRTIKPHTLTTLSLSPSTPLSLSLSLPLSNTPLLSRSLLFYLSLSLS